MKNILLLILSFVALPAWSQSVQYRPTAYTAPFVSTINSAAAAQTYLGIPSSTNNALLSGTNVFTGTNSFTGTVLITNAASTISGNGANMMNLAANNIASGSLNDARLSSNVALLGATNQTWTGTNSFPAASFYKANGIRLRSLFYTNIFFPNIYYSSNAVYPGSPTNASDWGTLSNKVKMTLPGLLSTNSSLVISVGAVRTNGTPERVSMMMYGGAATNPFYWATTFIGTSANPLQNPSGGSGGTLAFANYGSFTNQIPFPNAIGFYQDRFGTNICGDTSQPFDVYLGWASFVAGYVETNHLFIIRAFEVID